MSHVCLRAYILAQEEILSLYYASFNKITDWMLNPPFAEPQDRILGTIEGILSVRPVRITEVIGGAPTYGEQTAQDRYPVRISVEIELDIVVSEYGLGLGVFLQTRAIVQPNMVDSTSPVTLEKTYDSRPQEINKTIKRSLTVIATVDAEKEKQGVLDDFRIERTV